MAVKPKALEMIAAAVQNTTSQVLAAPEASHVPHDEPKPHHAAAAGLEAVQEKMAGAQTKMKEGYDRAMKTAEKMTHFHQANLEAMMRSSQILTSGLTDLTRHVAGSAQANMEETMSNLRALTSAKSLKEAFDLQTGFARKSLEKAMNESGKLTETSLKLVEEATAPLSARVTAAVETFTNRA